MIRAMHDERADGQRRKLTDASPILLFAGLVLLVCAALYSGFLVRLFRDGPLREPLLASIGVVRARFLAAGLVLVVLAELVRPRGLHRTAHWLFSRSYVIKLTLSLVLVVLPLYVLEQCLRPLADFEETSRKKTTIFAKDETLGWRLRPGVEDMWGGVKVKINAKGLRGPELPYEKAPGRMRVLYLGDSVAFGYRLADYRDAFPFRTSECIEQKTGRPVETVNAGVGGYSPWQQLAFLEKEGIRYAPDLVLLSFVLNDVAEKLDLLRFGGTGEGHQLRQSYYSLYDWLRHHSGIVHYVDKAKIRVRFGKDVQQGAERVEKLSIRSLCYEPDLPKYERAWQITLENLGKLVAFCRARDLPLLLVVFPYDFQFEDVPGSSAPQRKLRAFAQEHDVPFLDLLPPLGERIAETGGAARDLFVDHGHLSSYGSRLVADILARHAISEFASLFGAARNDGAEPDQADQPEPEIGAEVPEP